MESECMERSLDSCGGSRSNWLCNIFKAGIYLANASQVSCCATDTLFT
jgi:hypothetical protein